MPGAEDASGSKPVSNQYHLATIHWKLTGGDERGFIFRVYKPDALQGVIIEPARWQFPGLTVALETNIEGPFVSQNGPYTEIRYEANHKDAGFHIFINLTAEAIPLN